MRSIGPLARTIGRSHETPAVPTHKGHREHRCHPVAEELSAETVRGTSASRSPTSLSRTTKEGALLSTVSHRKVRWRGGVILIAVIILAACLAQTSSGHAVLRRAGLLEQPTDYTSLAFSSPQSVPTQVITRKKTVGISFTIRNASRMSYDYQWSVSLMQGSRTQHISAGTVRVASGRQVRIKQSAKIACTPGQVRIVVSLAHPAEFIDARAACVMGGK